MKKSKILTVAALALACSMSVGSIVNAASYTAFPKVFNYASGAPSSANHTTQYVEVNGNGNKSASAKCTSYVYTGNPPVLLVESVTTLFHTPSIPFTSIATKDIPYDDVIPTEKRTVKFQGTITNLGKSCEIKASVKG